MSLSPYIVKVIIDRVTDTIVHPEDLYSTVLAPTIAYVLLSFSVVLVFRGYDLLMLKVIPRLKADIVSEMFDYLQHHSYSYFQQNFSGNLSNKISDISKGAGTIISNIIDHFLARALALLIGTLTLLSVHRYFAFVLVLWAIVFVSVSIFMSSRSQTLAKFFSESRSSLIGKLVDSITNIMNIKLFARGDFESGYMRKALKETVAKDQDLHQYLLRIKTFQGLSIAVLISSMTSLLLYMRSNSMVTVGDFALVLNLTMAIVDETFLLARELVTFSEEWGTCSQALSLLTTPHEMLDRPNAKPLKVTRGEIAFENVHFCYKKGQNLFSDKSIVIKAGEKVGLVGFSGSGKSTFVNLIMRFFDIEKGQILIDGQNISHVTQDSLRGQIAMIPQDPMLFHRNLMENIRYGRLEASDEEVIACSKQAHCHLFVEKLKEGYLTLVGERGIKLSGGQRQRIAIARAILKNAPILILDEATSALDSVTENFIQESLAMLMQGRTTIVIAHRLSTLFHMDRILVFHEGRIIEEGTHQELINQDGHYAKLWNMQAGGFLGVNKRKAQATATAPSAAAPSTPPAPIPIKS
jgi:ATP-binding cassette subfamily B protein